MYDYVGCEHPDGSDVDVHPALFGDRETRPAFPPGCPLLVGPLVLRVVAKDTE